MKLICSNCGHTRTRSSKVIASLLNIGWTCKICGHHAEVGCYSLIGNLVIPHQEVEYLERWQQ